MSASEKILLALRERTLQENIWATSVELAGVTAASWSTVKRHLDRLVASGRVVREGQGRGTQYRLATGEFVPSPLSSSAGKSVKESPNTGFSWSPSSLDLLVTLRRPLAMRDVVGYERGLVDAYVPNESSLLPPSLAAKLCQEGRMQGQQPAGTYARKVLEQLLIDLSWSSSRLEGNRYSLLATKELFESGQAGSDLDAVMLLNHKGAIEFMVDAVPEIGLTAALIRNLHSILMQDLLADTTALGEIRQKVVNISGTTYLPTQVPSLLEEMFNQVIDKARRIKNPVESAFFLWVNLAYLQPFEDGNKRTSRLSANIPLMLYNCAPLSFIDVDAADYALAMLGVYEQRDASLATDLFEWAYRRSISRYAVTLDSMGVPDTVRLGFRPALTEAVGYIVRDRMRAAQAIAKLGMMPEQEAVFHGILIDELAALGLHNFGRYRLGMKQTEQWIAAGRPY